MNPDVLNPDTADLVLALSEQLVEIDNIWFSYSFSFSIDLVDMLYELRKRPDDLGLLTGKNMILVRHF